MRNDDYRNAEGYVDPTAYHGIRKAEGGAMKAKAGFLIKVIKFIAQESGFEIIGRIELRERKTGREFR